MPYSMWILGGTSVAILVYFNLLDKNTQRWRNIENKNDLYAYIAFLGSIIVGIVGSLVENYLF